MAIKISGTTVIDDSRNICNIGTINATNVNGAVAGKYICMIGCTDITEGTPVMSCDGCTAICCVASPEYTFENSGVNTEGFKNPANSVFVKFLCNDCCYVSLRYTENGCCCCPSIMCMRTHCIDASGAYTSEELCCQCIPQSCKFEYAKGSYAMIGPCVISSCSGTKSWVLFPYASICDCRHVITMCFCYCTTTNQISHLGTGCECFCDGQGGQICQLIAFAPMLTPDRNYFVNFIMCSGICDGVNKNSCCCLACDTEIGLHVQCLDDNFCGGTCIFKIGTRVSGISYCCALYQCCMNGASSDDICVCIPGGSCVLLCIGNTAKTNSAQTGSTAGISPFTMGVDNWLIASGWWMRPCVKTRNQLMFITQYFGLKPVGDQQFCTTCNIFMPMFTNCHATECCRFPYAESCPQAETAFRQHIWGFTGYDYACTPTNITRAWDEGDGIKRFFFNHQSNISNYNLCSQGVGIACLKVCGDYLCNVGHTKSCGITMNYPAFGCDCCYKYGNTGNFINSNNPSIFNGINNTRKCSCSEPRFQRILALDYARQARQTNNCIAGLNTFLYSASYPICPAQGIYAFAGDPSVVIGTQDPGYNILCAHGLAPFKNCINAEVGCYNLATPVFCWQWCHSNVECSVTSDCCCICPECAIVACILCSSTIRYAGISPLKCDQYRYFETGMEQMRGGDVIIAGGKSYYTMCQYCTCTQCTVLASFVGINNLPVANHCYFMGIAQNTVSAGETVKVAVPGMTDRSSFASTYFCTCTNQPYVEFWSHCPTQKGVGWCTVFGIGEGTNCRLYWYNSTCCQDKGIRFNIYYDCFTDGLVNQMAYVGFCC